MSEKIRIDKFLTSQNICSRKDAGKLIRKSLVSIDGVVIKQTDMKIDPAINTVKVNGEVISYSKYTYIMMNKPKGVLSATRDKKAETVLDLIPKDMIRKNMFPAGRLDKDTVGLLIITDDGELAHKMLSPKSHVYKLYKAKLDMPITEEDVKEFEKGISGDTLSYLPAKLETLDDDKTEVKVWVREGKFHQVKRMFKIRGKEVLELERLQIGTLYLDDNLQRGECKTLSIEEIEKVFG